MTPTARFLVLLDDARRALLFDSKQCLIGEVIDDDGHIVDHLLKLATACPIPHARMLDAMVPPPSQPVRCYDLG